MLQPCWPLLCWSACSESCTISHQQVIRPPLQVEAYWLAASGILQSL